MPWTYQTDFASSPEAAGERFASACDRDPFPDVGGALLNSAHIAAYAREAGLIYEFRPEALKTASYPARVGSTICYWDAKNPEDTNPIIEALNPGELFRLPQFSLVFVQTEEEFFLPNYIAARFNLQIEFVHKGLLLGTGPIVDPGFAGHLVIPLHNFTSNEYRIARGQDLIWVEFAKTSSRPSWHQKIDKKSAGEQLSALENTAALLKEFKKEKRFLTIGNYLDKAQHDRFESVSPGVMEHYLTITNAIPKDIGLADSKAEKALKEAKSAKRRVKYLSIGAIIAAILGVAGLGAGVVNLFNQSLDLGSEIIAQRTELLARVTQLENGIAPELSRRITEIQAELTRLRGSGEEIESLKKSVEAMQAQLADLLDSNANSRGPVATPPAPEPSKPKQ